MFCNIVPLFWIFVLQHFVTFFFPCYNKSLICGIYTHIGIHLSTNNITRVIKEGITSQLEYYEYNHGYILALLPYIAKHKNKTWHSLLKIQLIRYGLHWSLYVTHREWGQLDLHFFNNSWGLRQKLKHCYFFWVLWEKKRKKARTRF